ncbi:penicillin-binding transpeptidase domain-containing protein [Blastococcus sp. TML/C7B]|uniref:penicillin-binding transpeptidase domain-containing protein n=1 Tax=Blastococcus sp. TML/C7B TaxID=2798728 RepID=UPI0028161772|nr:penicillin-binding transpeptidase domain-containing protein [Blastococcus sp. TML/C7B]
MAVSNDVYFYKLAVALGADRLVGTARDLGVGVATGVDLPGESAGRLGSPELAAAEGQPWYGGSTVILGIGQGDLQVTPLQNAGWTAAIATGALVTPRLAMALGTGPGTSAPLPAPPPRPLPFDADLGPVREGMRAVVAGGTGSRLNDLPVPVGAKTGTAQDGGLRDDEYDNWMSAVAPLTDPEIVMTALVQGPGTGGNSASAVVDDALHWFYEHHDEVLAVGPPAP